MRIHYLQHVPFEDMGAIHGWADAGQYPVTVTRFYELASLPPHDSYDFLIVMGGPMNIDEYSKYPWLREEKAFIRRAIEERKRVLGICLGAQLIASALGSRVTRNPEPEIGWFPVQSTVPAEHPIGRFFYPEVETFHWHGDTFSLPPGAERLAKSRACSNQAFAFEEHVLAFQFHLETTPVNARKLIEHCGGELKKGPYIQMPSEMLADLDRYTEINGILTGLLDFFTRPERL